MPEITEEIVVETLRGVKFPGFSRDVVSFGLVKGVRIDGSDVLVMMAVSTAEPNIAKQIKEEAVLALEGLNGIGRVSVKIDVQAPSQTSKAFSQQEIAGVKSVIAVASGKGGVGKSTVAANLAVALANSGAAVGLCDCDIYGPSMALMFGSTERPMANEEEQILPIERYGIKLMSMGFLLEDDAPAVLRGPMVTRYTQQFLRQVAWGNLDYLILDLPPGTGDIQLTIVQTVALSGAVVVTTPQEVALIDARKAVGMFGKTGVQVLGIVENMSYFICPNDGNRYAIFGEGGGAREAKRLNVPLLGEVPIDIATRECGDTGMPVTGALPESPVGQAFKEIAQGVMAGVNAA